MIGDRIRGFSTQSPWRIVNVPPRLHRVRRRAATAGRTRRRLLRCDDMQRGVYQRKMRQRLWINSEATFHQWIEAKIEKAEASEAAARSAARALATLRSAREILTPASKVRRYA